MSELVQQLNACGLGLRRGEVCIAEYNPRWPVVAARVVAHVGAALGVTMERVQHVGSTAVEGLAAKPILDVVVGLEEGDSMETAAAKLAGVGYIDRGAGEGSIGRLLVLESSADVRVVHVHIVGHRSGAWRDYVEFRDRLVRDAEVRDRYAALKRGLGQRFGGDRQAYRDAKSAFVEGVLRTATSLSMR